MLQELIFKSALLRFLQKVLELHTKICGASYLIPVYAKLASFEISIIQK